MHGLSVLLRAARLPFLVLTPVSVFLGASIAFAGDADVDVGLFALVFTGAMLAHVSVNMLNEYQDFCSGLDLTTNRTAFSGGSGALPESPGFARWVLAAAALTLFTTLCIGVLILARIGPGILPIGVLGVLLIVTYTDVINRYPVICLVSPGLGFGVFMVLGTHIVLVGDYSVAACLIAAVPFFMINNLLLLNQYPDIRSDAAAGRNHFPIAYGIPVANAVYGLFVAAAAMAILTGVLGQYFPARSLAALLPLPLALYALSGAVKHGKAIGSYPRYLTANVMAAVLVPLVLAAAVATG